MSVSSVHYRLHALLDGLVDRLVSPSQLKAMWLVPNVTFAAAVISPCSPAYFAALSIWTMLPVKAPLQSGESINDLASANVDS